MYRPAVIATRLARGLLPASHTVKPQHIYKQTVLRIAAGTHAAATTPQSSLERHIRGITWLSKELEAAKCPYMLIGGTAALAQGTKVDPASIPYVSAEVQWDFLATLHSNFQKLCPSPIQRVPAGLRFTMKRQGKAHG